MKSRLNGRMRPLMRCAAALLLLCAVALADAAAAPSARQLAAPFFKRRSTKAVHAQRPFSHVQSDEGVGFTLPSPVSPSSWFGAAVDTSSPGGADGNKPEQQRSSWLRRIGIGRPRSGTPSKQEHAGSRPTVKPEDILGSLDERTQEEDEDELEALLGKPRLKTADDSGDDNGDGGEGGDSDGNRHDRYVGHGGGDDDDDDDGDDDGDDDDGGDDNGDNGNKRTQGERLVMQMLRQASEEADTDEEMAVAQGVGDDADVESASTLAEEAQLKRIWKQHVSRWTPEELAMGETNAQDMIQRPETLPRLNWQALFWNALEAMTHPANATLLQQQQQQQRHAWIEPAVVSQLKGTALLCHEPKLAMYTTKLPRPARGIRLVTPRATHQMQRAIASALAASVGAAHVFIDEETLEAVRAQAANEGVSNGMLSRQVLLSTLIELAEEEGDRYVITLCDKGTPVLNSEPASEVVLDEMNNPASRIFFVLTSVTSNVTEAGVQTATILPPPQDQSSPRTLPEGTAPNVTARFRMGMPPPSIFSMLSQKLLRDFVNKRRQEQAGTRDRQHDDKSGQQPMRPAPADAQFGASQDASEQKPDADSMSMVSFPVIISDPTGTNRFPIPMIPLQALLELDRLPNAEMLLRQRPPSQSQQPRTPTSAETLSGLFEDVVVPPPEAPALRACWEKVLIDDAQSLICRRNSMVLERAMRENHVSILGGLAAIQPLLSWRVLTEEQVDSILLTALKVEAAQSSEGLKLQKGADPTWVLSPLAVEIAVRDVCGRSIPSPSKTPSARSKEEIDAMIQDKQERGLLANIISPQDIGVTYDMIGGLDDVKELLRQCVTYPLKYPHLYKEGIAAEAVKGVLLFGPPGTGKTMLAKAVATEGGATFLSIDASTIESKWLGESEKNARAVFTLARKLAPCVIYMDEVDSVLSSRERGDDSSHGTLTSVKTTIMQEWDGLRTTTDRVLVIASTNRPYDLDEAVLRRLPRRILVDLPDRETRKAVLEVCMRGNRVSPDVNFTMIADQLEGYTGSDIKEICREAVVRIAHEQAREYEQGAQVNTSEVLRPITSEDFDKAIQKLRASVNQEGRELSRVWEWNEKFGEIKKKKPRSQFSMYL